MKKMKRLLTLALALCLSVPSIPFVAKDAVVVQAQETTKSWEDWVDSLDNNASMAIAIARYVFPVPAGPIAKVRSC